MSETITALPRPFRFRLLAPFARPDTYRALLFFVAVFAFGTVAFAAFVVGWSVTVALAITPLVFPLLIGLRALVGATAWGHAFLARELLGAQVDPPLHTDGPSFWRRALNVPADRSFWLQQAYSLIVWPIALVQVALLSQVGQLVALPIYYRWADEEDMYGLFQVDSFSESLPFMAAGLVLLVLAVHLAGVLAGLAQRLATRMLGGDATRLMLTPAERRARRLRSLKAFATVVGGIALLLTAIWALTGGETFWPVWPVLPLAVLLAICSWIVLVLERPEVSRRTLGSQALAMHAGFWAAVWLFLVAIWALAGGGYFWPAWPLLGFAAVLLVHVAIVLSRRGKLEERIEELEATRAGAVGVHEAELRRIERDLHDGAQASLVALGMNLGMAEQKLTTDPDGARELLEEARRGAGAALEELRDLARGIHPPVLGDRGLEAAVVGLAARSPVHVSVAARIAERPPAAVETAAYFVVAESIANASKHAGADRLEIRMSRDGDVLVVEVEDDGRGGADPAGHGLTGLRQRVQALDGMLELTSPLGGPTVVRARLPCGS
jgi:signal transduction histidine kinase